MYYRYVDNTFSIFDNANDCDKFLHELNSLHPSLRFTFVKKVNRSFPFLDVQVEKVGSKLITPVYCKLTFTNLSELEILWPRKRQFSLIFTLVH